MHFWVWHLKHFTGLCLWNRFYTYILSIFNLIIEIRRYNIIDYVHVCIISYVKRGIGVHTMLYGKRFFSASILPGKTISTSSAFGNLASTTSTGGVWWGVLSSVLRPAMFVYTLSTLILNWTVKTICPPFFVFIIDFLRCHQISNIFKKRQILTSYLQYYTQYFSNIHYTHIFIGKVRYS